MRAIHITLSPPDSLRITWDDGHESTIPLLSLRDNCPCAGCQGETILLKTYSPAPRSDSTGMYNITSIQQVGHYAIQIFWADGHSTGIYPWKLLRDLCQCQFCKDQKSE